MSFIERVWEFFKKLFRRDTQTTQLGLGSSNLDQRQENQFTPPPPSEPIKPPVVEPTRPSPVSMPEPIKTAPQSPPIVSRPEPIAPKPMAPPPVVAPKIEPRPPMVPDTPMSRSEVSIPKPEPKAPFAPPPLAPANPLDTRPLSVGSKPPVEQPKMPPPMPPPLAPPPVSKPEVRPTSFMNDPSLGSTSPLTPGEVPSMPASKAGAGSRFATVQPMSAPIMAPKVPNAPDPFAESVGAPPPKPMQPMAPPPVAPKAPMPPPQAVQPMVTAPKPPTPPMAPPPMAPPPMAPPAPPTPPMGDMQFNQPAPPQMPVMPQPRPQPPVAPQMVQPPKPPAMPPAMPSAMPKPPVTADHPSIAQPPKPTPPPSFPGGGGATTPAQGKYNPGATNDQAAQRLARLLVSEIKLYNEKKIAEGRKNSNLYDVLKDTIEQSRKHYKERMGTSIEAMPDYFHEELVKTLCEGDSSKLGTNYQK